MHQAYYIAFISLLFFISANGQAQEKSFSITSGITNSSLPIYSQKAQTQLISNQSVNNLSFSASYNRKIKKNFVLKTALSYKRIGGNSLSKNIDIEGYFVHNVSLNYLSLSTLGYAELHFEKHTFSLGFGPSASYLVKKQVVDFLYVNNAIVGKESEPIAIDPIDFGFHAAIEVNRVIANNIKLIVSVRRYQGLLDINVEGEADQIYLSNNVLSLGLEIPLKK